MPSLCDVTDGLVTALPQKSGGLPCPENINGGNVRRLGDKAGITLVCTYQVVLFNNRIQGLRQ